MKKCLQKLSRKRSLRLRVKLERKSKRLLLLASLNKAYRRLRRIGRTPAVSLYTLRRNMSRDELDIMGDTLERMSVSRDSARIYFVSR